MPDIGHAAPPAFPPWSTHDWSSTLLELLRQDSVLLNSGASFFPVSGASLTIPRLTVDPDAAAWLDPGDEFPEEDVEGDSIKLTPRKLGIVTGIDIEAIEDSDTATLDVIGASLSRALAKKLDARVFSTAAADKGPAGLLPSFTAQADALAVIPLLEAVDRIDGQATELATRIADAEAELSEWQEATEDEALGLLRGLVDVVQGRVSRARGTAALHDALASVLAGIWLSYDDGRLRAEFRLADTATPPSETERRRVAHLFAYAEPVGLDAERVTLRPTSPQTLVNRPVWAQRPAARDPAI